jgi:hypothetical protein
LDYARPAESSNPPSELRVAEVEGSSFQIASNNTNIACQQARTRKHATPPPLRIRRIGEKRAGAAEERERRRASATRTREPGGRGTTTRKMAAARKTHGGGRPPKPAKCPEG